jgi:uncharacterized coiled-coil protein SlyX
LIAEEVAEVNPDLVAFNDRGEPETVRYDSVNAMLLNEFLKEHQRVEELRSSDAEHKKQIADLRSAMAEQEKQMKAVVTQLRARSRYSNKARNPNQKAVTCAAAAVEKEFDKLSRCW